MLTDEMKGRLWRYLKEKPPADMEKIAADTGIPIEAVDEFVTHFIHRGFLEITMDGKVHIVFVLDPVHQVRDKVKFYDYNEIRKHMPQSAEASPIPRRYMSPSLEYLPDYCDQGTRGTCVGWSLAIGLTMLHIAEMIKRGLKLPTLEGVKHGYVERPEGMSCNLIREIYFDIWKSAQFIYWGARKRGNVTYPTGAWLEDAVPFAKETGAVLETDIHTSITNTCAPDFYPWEWKQGGNKSRDEAIKEAGKFKITGYAQTTDFETCCRMIYEQGVAWVGVTIYDNYMSGGCFGIYPDPNGIEDGGHAQVAVGYDLDKGEIYFKQTWKRWKGLGGVSKRYWNYVGYSGIRAVDMAFCPIGLNMVNVAEKLYSKVRFISNVDVTFYLDDVKRPEKREFSVALETGTTHKIKAVAAPNTTKEGSIERLVTPVNPEYIEEFKFTSQSTNDWIRAIIEAIFRKIGWVR
jgi:hypothetical protein